MIAEIKDKFWEYTITVVTDGDIDRVIQDDLLLEMSDIGNDVLGTSMILPSGEMIVWFNTNSSESENDMVDTIAHEAVHLSRHILHNVQNTPLTDNTEEVYARLIGKITAQIFKVL